MIRFGFIAMLLMGCGSAPDPAPSGTQVVLSLQEISCQSCGAQSINALKKTPGIEKATFDRDSAELTVAFDPAQTNPENIAKIISDLGYGVKVGAGQGRYTAEVEFSKVDFAWISEKGEAVELEANLVEGKVTVFDFSATWCGPCKKVDREMLSILELKDDVSLRKLNVTDWESPVAKKYLANVPSLPYVIVYGRKGQRVKAISGLDLDALNAAIEAGRNQ